jgi:hypothetical protein
MGNYSNQAIINKGRTLATGQTNGMLNPEQSEKFMQMVFDDSSFLGQLRHEMRRSTKGTIEKLGVGRRLLRKKTEGEMPLEKDWVEPVLGAVPYSTVDIVLGAEISEKFIRENIEREGFEDTFMGMIAQQVKVDLLDLVFNGDTAATGDDAAFLTIVDGINKKLSNGSHILDAATLAGGKFTDDIFTKALKILPTKYFNRANYRWIANTKTYLTWIEYLKRKETTAGDMAILNGQNFNPLGINWAEVPNFPDGKIILADPKNFTVVNTYDIKLRKTIEGKEAVMRDTRYYAIHLDVDPIILEKEAVVVIDKVPDNI